MFNQNRRSFFERITGSISVNDEEDEIQVKTQPSVGRPTRKPAGDWLTAEEPVIEEVEEMGELSVDVYQTDTEIVVQAMVAGVRPEDLNLSITREMVTLEGRRQKTTEAEGDGYFMKELYWGAFSRKILLPCEVEPDEAEAFEKNGLLTLRMPKIDKARTQKVKVRSL